MPPFSVTAELLFQSVSYRFAADLLEEEGELAERFGTLYEAADKKPVVVATVEGTVE